MGAREQSRSAGLRARLTHPVIDSDGHTLEFQPALLDYLREVGGKDIAERYTRLQTGDTQRWYQQTLEERMKSRLKRPAWWGVHTQNVLDRVTCTLPRLLYDRLDEMGIDFSIIYPTVGLGIPHLQDEPMRRAATRAVNRMHADIFREFSDRLTPAAVIPMHSPTEAIEELEHAVRTLGMKVVVMASYVLRPRADGNGNWFDSMCLDSIHDYDPVWAKCIELGVTPTFHSSTQGMGTRNSISNYMYNHIGHFAAAGDALCKAAFIGGVTRRFPSLRMGFLEGGVGWACTLYADLIGHWKKRSGKCMEHYNPARLDRELFRKLHHEYGGKLVEGRLENERDMELALWKGMAFLGGVDEDPSTIDEFFRCGIERGEDIRDRFVPNFFFGCEADDTINSWAFDSKKNPYGARLQAVFSSDIGHWDVEDMRDILREAHELVDEGLINENDFRDFVFANPLRMWTDSNPDFFKGTVIDGHMK